MEYEFIAKQTDEFDEMFAPIEMELSELENVTIMDLDFDESLSIGYYIITKKSEEECRDMTDENKFMEIYITNSMDTILIQ